MGQSLSMETRIADRFKSFVAVQDMENVLRSCVHCGFCLATCPTYQILGDERDSPRGRIYLIKALIEGKSDGEETRFHLDRCLTCRSCETTCPSGVQYGRLLGEARQLLEDQVPRPWFQRLVRFGLKQGLSYPARFSLMMTLAQWIRPLLPKNLQQRVPQRTKKSISIAQHSRRVMFLAGCVQPALRPGIQDAAMRLLDGLGISGMVSRQAGCCGALNHHLGDEAAALVQIRANIDAWWPAIEAGTIEAVITTASACGVEVRDYGHVLRRDQHYAEKARRVSALVSDIGEFLARELGQNEDEQRLALHSLGMDLSASRGKVAFQIPCTMQHGLRSQDTVQGILRASGVELSFVDEAHLCCGSAGTYSILQPTLSNALRTRKLMHLQAGEPSVILSANLGCQLHLEQEAEVPVVHWVEWLDQQIMLDRQQQAIRA